VVGRGSQDLENREKPPKRGEMRGLPPVYPRVMRGVSIIDGLGLSRS